MNLRQNIDYATFSSVQFSSVTQLCPTLCDPTNCSMPGKLPIRYIPCPVEEKNEGEDGGICELDHVTNLLKVHWQLSIDFRLKIRPPQKNIRGKN